jgi:hypothetical protein
MSLKEKIQDAYMDYVLSQGHEPHSVYVFCKNLEIKESDFYEFYNSFHSIGMDIWESLFTKTREMIEKQEVWAEYSVREKILSFFYSFCELLKSFRSYASFSFKPGIPGLKESSVLGTLKKEYYQFIDGLITEGLDTGEILDRKFLTDRYRDGLWVQFLFIVQFWIKDSSLGFEKTDEAIEKGVNLSFDLMARSPLDSILDYSRFLARNGSFSYERTK